MLGATTESMIDLTEAPDSEDLLTTMESDTDDTLWGPDNGKFLLLNFNKFHAPS